MAWDLSRIPIERKENSVLGRETRKNLVIFKVQQKCQRNILSNSIDEQFQGKLWKPEATHLVFESFESLTKNMRNSSFAPANMPSTLNHCWWPNALGF